MFGNKNAVQLRPLSDRGPLRVVFVVTSMPVGGAETLLVNLIRGLNRSKFTPELVCLKHRGPLADELAGDILVHDRLLAGKFDLRVLFRLTRLFRERQADAVVTVGAGDKMFWGRWAAHRAGVPVIASALHSTGWPDGVGRLNRRLTNLTDAFIAVAGEHGRFLIDEEGFPAEKVRVIPNGINTERFQFDKQARDRVRQELRIPATAPVCGIVAALRPEKNHSRFLRVAGAVRESLPAARFLIVGDGPERHSLEALAAELNLRDAVVFAGCRDDIPAVLSACDVFALTSDNEANPVSILEAMACGLPVVAPRVGSISESVADGDTGFLAPPTDEDLMGRLWRQLLGNQDLRRDMGERGRRVVVDRWSVQRMIAGYEDLIRVIYEAKCSGGTPAVEHSESPERSMPQ